jgi:hypothetical protein
MQLCKYAKVHVYNLVCKYAIIQVFNKESHGAGVQERKNESITAYKYASIKKFGNMKI